jgi:uncharacterized membrane protein
MGKVPKVLGATYTVAGILAIAVGVVHFAMAQHLRHLIAGWVEGSNKELVLAVFEINHTGSGVFILLIGVILVLAGMRGMRRGKRWAAEIGLVCGLGLVVLASWLWVTVPPMFLDALPFRGALLGLGAVGLLLVLPAVIYWKDLEAD